MQFCIAAAGNAEVLFDGNFEAFCHVLRAFFFILTVMMSAKKKIAIVFSNTKFSCEKLTAGVSVIMFDYVFSSWSN